MTKLVQVRGCINVDYDGYNHVEEADDEFAEFFGVYVENEENLMMWHSDYATREEAEMAAEELGVVV